MSANSPVTVSQLVTWSTGQCY